MIFAGPVFQEWYWGPFFFALFFGPFILTAAAILTGIVAYRARRRAKPLTWLRGLRLFVGLTVALSLLMVGGLWAKERIEESRIIASQAAAITFQTYEPSWVFTDYDALRVRPLAIFQRQSVEFSYRRGDDYVYAAQSPSLSPVNPSEEGCGGRPKGLTSGETVGSCRTVVTESGRVVYLTNLDMNHLGDRVATIELGGTRVDVIYSELPDEAAVRYLDSLEPVAPEDMNYFGGYN